MATYCNYWDTTNVRGIESADIYGEMLHHINHANETPLSPTYCENVMANYPTPEQPDATRPSPQRWFNSHPVHQEGEEEEEAE